MKKFMSLLLSVLLLLSLVPMTVAATGEDWNSFVYSQDGPVFSFEATEFTGSGSYKFYAAAYDNAGKLLAVKSSNATVTGDTLSAEVDFEPGNTEANVNIASVKTMLWNGITPIVRAGEFTITAPTATAGTDTYAMTNGFYEAIAATDDYAYCFYLGDGTNEDYSYRNTSDGTGKGYDNDLSTALGFDGIQSYSRIDFVKLSAAAEIDRVVTWTYDNPSSVPNPRQTGTEYYLVNLDAELNSSSASSAIKAVWDGMNTSATSANYYYLGTLASEARFVTDDDARTVMDVNSANTYQYMAAKKDNRVGVSGKTVELQAYKNKVQQDVVDAFTVTADYNGFKYTQDGPVFGVEAHDFVLTNADTVKLIATAYSGENGTGTVLATDEKTITLGQGVETELFAHTVDLEKGATEAPVSIESVVVRLTDATGGSDVAPARTFDIIAQSVTDGVYNNFTNGFYEPVVGNNGVSLSKWEFHGWNYTTDAETGATTVSGYVYTYDEAKTDDVYNICDGKPATRNIYNLNVTNQSRYFQDIATLSSAATVDRVVVLPAYGQTGIYLAKSLDNVKTVDHMALFNGTSNDNIKFLGNNESAVASSAVDSLTRYVYDADGDSYQYLIADYRYGGSGMYEYHAYKHVKDERVVEAYAAPTYNVAEDAAAFSYNSATDKTAAMAVDGDVATSWVSAGTGAVADNFVLDLGRAYNISAISVLPASTTSAQNITVYGGVQTATNATTAENQDKTQIATIGATELSTTTATALTVTPGAYRYIMFEQAANAANAMGFAEIYVYTTDTPQAAIGPVNLVSGSNKTPAQYVYISQDRIAGSKNTISFGTSAACFDGNPSTGWGGQSNTGRTNGIHAIVRLNASKNITHVAYQSIASDYRYNRNFKVIGTNDANFATYDVLATAGTPVTSADGDTGLWVIPVSGTYSYVGIIQEYVPSGTIMSLQVNELQVYATN